MKEYTEQEFNQFYHENYTGLTYLYTPLCGTCQTASKILTVVEELLDVEVGKINLNYAPVLAKTLSIQSVPCLLVILNGEISEKIYVFHSVPYLYEKLNKRFNLKKVH